MRTFKERVGDFWEWFDKNECKIADYIKNISNDNGPEVVAFVSDGLNKAINECIFELGGKNEINLASNGDMAMMTLGSYLVAAMPEKYNGKWQITPWKVALPWAELKLGDVNMGAKDILVKPEYDNGSFTLRFYNSTLSELEEDQAYHVFVLVLDLVLGENIAIGFISNFEQTDEKEEGMIPLSELSAYMAKALQEDGKELTEDFNPSETYSGYGLEPSENENPRYDIVAGFTRMTSLLDEYYNDESDTINMLEANGVKAVYITFNRTSEDHQTDMDIRNTITDRLEEEILGESGSGEEYGIILGQAVGTDRCYIDLLLYDEVYFTDRVCSVLKDYNLDYSLYSFRAGSTPTELC